MNSDGTRKVEVFQRADNTFGFEELSFWQEEQAWLPVGKYSIAIIDSLERAIKEAKGRVAWLSHEAQQALQLTAREHVSQVLFP